MPQSFQSLYSHVIFGTKNRERWIDPELKPPLYSYMGRIVKEKSCILTAIGGMPDHVHLLLSMQRDVSHSELLRLVKANSSRWVHENFPHGYQFAWQNGYAAFSVSYSNIGAVEAYLANQEEHHRNRTFKDELIAFLRKHGVSYDEQYILD